MFRTDRTKVHFAICVLLICSAITLMAQPSSSSDSVVPAMVKFAGTLNDTDGKPLTGTQGVTFLLYKEQTGGAPLWIETQNVQADKSGHYTVMLGAATSHGLPADAFQGGEARWLAAQPHGHAEPARVVLASVPYAMKALDAETLGGKPASAFLQALHFDNEGAAPGGDQAQKLPPTVHGNGVANYVPVWTAKNIVGESAMFQSGSNIGIGTTSPGYTLTVVGTIASSQGVFAENSQTCWSCSGVTGLNTAAGPGVFATSSAGYGLSAQSLSSYGIYASSDSSHGIFGISNANFFGVVGEGGSAGVYGSGGYGMLGFGTSGYGIYGQSVGGSTVGSEIPTAGVWGDTNTPVAAGVAGTGQDGVGGIFLNDSPTGYYALVAANYASSGPMFVAENVANHTSCNIDAGGNLNCTGAKHAVVPIDGGKRKVALSAIESPVNWFEDAGSAHLANGAAVVTLDPDFIQTVNTEMEYNVVLTPYADCKGLFVANRTASSFEVHEIGGGTANVGFGYRIMALRRKYENVRFEDHTNDLDPKKMLVQMRKTKPAAFSSPSPLKPVSQPAAGIPLPQLSKQ